MTTPRTREELNSLLAACFKGCTLVVQDEMFGYRHHPDSIALVEVCDPDADCQSGSYVVKVAPAADLRRELDGYRSCWPPSLRHDLVFMPVRAFPEESPDSPQALIYGDAQQLIGVPQTCTLEQAMLNAVLYGRPTVTSVREVLVQLYERAGHLFYHVGREDPPTRKGYRLEVPGASGPLRPNNALTRALGGWKNTPRLTQVRLEVDSPIMQA